MDKGEEGCPGLTRRLMMMMMMVVVCVCHAVDGPSSVFGSSRASCAPLGADQSSCVPAAAGTTPILSSPAGAASVPQIGAGLSNQNLFTPMPATEVQFQTFS